MDLLRVILGIGNYGLDGFKTVESKVSIKSAPDILQVGEQGLHNGPRFGIATIHSVEIFSNFGSAFLAAVTDHFVIHIGELAIPALQISRIFCQSRLRGFVIPAGGGLKAVDVYAKLFELRAEIHGRLLN